MGTPRTKVGTEFNRLTLTQYLGGGRWLCQCTCGNTTTAVVADLRKTTKSCGCLRRERAAAIGAASATHGMSGTREYHVWEAMWRRCVNAQDAGYSRYGGRGIKVCRRWKKFENFFADMGERPSAKHTLERKNNDGPYSPFNCVWVTRKVQARNRRTNRLLTFAGRTQCLLDWSIELGIGKQVIWDRLDTGWTVAEALTTPVASRTPRDKSKKKV